MKFKIMLLNIVLSFTLLSFSSCTIEGEAICGIWNAKGDYGTMQLEITPWKGKFHGYLLEYQNGSETIKGAKTDENIFISDLVFNENKYENGKIYFDPNSEAFCGLTLEMLNENQLKATYDCEGQTSEEVWYRKGYDAPQKSVPTPELTKIENAETKRTETDVTPKVASGKENKNEEVVSSTKKPKASSVNATKPSVPEIDGETKKQASFYIIGIQEVVKYDDYKGIEKSMEAMWNTAYNDDFSTKLNNIVEASNIYVSYSSYDNPKGKMTITLGYKVKGLSNIPSGLKGVKIPSNEFLVYPMAGDKSDYEGDGWEQLGELMMYRKANSADFEVYTFDSSYNVKKAEMWIATK